MSVSNGEKGASFQVWEDTVGRRRQLLPPRTWIHLIVWNPSSILVNLACHQVGWPWVESLSRSGVYIVARAEIFFFVLRVSILIL